MTPTCAPASPPPDALRFAPRGRWTGRMGFLLACAGSAVGLGNIWKFPYIAGENGGGLFVLLYIVSIVFIGVPLMIGEFAIGRASQQSPVSAFGALSERRGPWTLVGWLGVATSFAILAFYSVVGGWTLHYLLLSLTNFIGDPDAPAVGAHFAKVYQSGGLNVFWHAVFIAATAAIVAAGVRDGIERASLILMPVLLGLLVVLLLRVLTMPGFTEALVFVFVPNASRLTPGGVLEAVGHAFFTLSLGQGIMIVYGSYLPRETDIVASAITVSIIDTFVALAACLIVFPVVFSYGMDPQGGPGLIFQTMPMLFQKMPAGWIFSVLFFTLLVAAALSSSISMLEVPTSALIDTFGWERRKAVGVVAGAVFIVGIPAALSGGPLADTVIVDGMNYFETLDYFATNWALPIGGFLTALFVGFRMDPALVRREFGENSTAAGLFVPWMNCVRYVCPVAVAAVLLYSIGLI